MVNARVLPKYSTILLCPNIDSLMKCDMQQNSSTVKIIDDIVKATSNVLKIITIFCDVQQSFLMNRFTYFV